MSGANLQHLLAMVLYMAAVVGIGIYFAGRANKDAESYFLGGRSLGPWVTAFSAEASDMSGYLLMGLPGLAYWTGLADAGWTCIGLAIGTYLNFLIVSKRLRRYSIAVDAFTLPDFFSNRFHEKKKIIMTICSLIIIIFFSVYAAQCLSTCGKLFANLFGGGALRADLRGEEDLAVAVQVTLLDRPGRASAVLAEPLQAGKDLRHADGQREAEILLRNLLHAAQRLAHARILLDMAAEHGQDAILPPALAADAAHALGADVLAQKLEQAVAGQRAHRAVHPRLQLLAAVDAELRQAQGALVEGDARLPHQREEDLLLIHAAQAHGLQDVLPEAGALGV